MASNLKILWSPIHEDQFLTYSSTINLYKVIKCKNGEVPKGNPGQKLAENTHAVLEATNSEIQFMKTVAWYPKSEPDNLVAVGQANGKITLISFGQQQGSSDLIGKEFIPKHNRHCLYLAWNPVESHLLAEGLDKYRNDNCIAIWDINAKPGGETTTTYERQRYSSYNESGAITKPAIELGSSETTGSFSWFYKEPRTFVTGMNAKLLKIFDLRDTTRPHLIAQTKNVFGLCTDPRNEFRLASFHENQVSVWDVRNFEKPILTLPETRPVMKINWCPTRMGFLAVLCKETSVIKLYDIRHANIGLEDLEPAIIERNIQPYGQHALTAFSWHPIHENRMLTISPPCTIKDITVYERIPVQQSSTFQIIWGCGKKMTNVIQNEASSEIDISIRMRQRALKGYGLKIQNAWHNAGLIPDEPHLHGLWQWLYLVRRMAEENIRCGVIKTNSPGCRSIGIRGVLKLNEENGLRSEVTYNHWEETEGRSSNKLLMKQYFCEERSKALWLCDWAAIDDKEGLEGLLDRLNFTLFRFIFTYHTFVYYSLQETDQYEKAAALAIFNLKIGKAIDILSSCKTSANTEGHSADLNAVAMALAGYTEERFTLWRRTCVNLLQKVKNSYLRAMFAFLSSDKDNYDEILKDEQCMTVSDRVAFACIYLPDHKLKAYVDDLSRRMRETGNLDGLLLTGLTSEGIDLLQRYVDLSGDIQTAALAAVYSFPCDIAKDERVRVWIENYRDLLDRWRLWHHRALFDNFRHENDTSLRIPSQAFVSCNYCGKTIACNMTMASRSRPFVTHSSTGTLSSHKPRTTCCPSCRKPLPRCALCLTNLGTPSGSGLYQMKPNAEFENKLSSFSDWFTWCQTCRHGGHTAHTMDWFKNHKECPVTGCNCKCVTLDHISRLSANQPTFLSDS
ncbi:hypothetical protein KUTeg_008530 [Tegillarca granosa]|uniref:WD repeat protein mio zinc-ribbon like domain-containing protein n=1 Tax=Tegillarca granosa TaxID=220873 RepID=A0ABQ9F9D1_TEGGR|nr:hypothetical protein KUTeg_008530 [Tegillarca granosa]